MIFSPAETLLPSIPRYPATPQLKRMSEREKYVTRPSCCSKVNWRVVPDQTATNQFSPSTLTLICHVHHTHSRRLYSADPASAQPGTGCDPTREQQWSDRLRCKGSLQQEDGQGAVRLPRLRPQKRPGSHYIRSLEPKSSSHRRTRWSLPSRRS